MEEGWCPRLTNLCTIHRALPARGRVLLRRHPQGPDLTGAADNETDMAYLFLFTLAMMFTSNDKLHRRTAPLFMRDDQIFQPADELKTDLRALDQFYSSLPAETMKDGLFKAAPLALEHERFLTTQLYHRLGVRTPNPSAAMPSSSPESHSPAEGLIARVKGDDGSVEDPPRRGPAILAPQK